MAASKGAIPAMSIDKDIQITKGGCIANQRKKTAQ
jgi:hypothetical protein